MNRLPKVIVLSLFLVSLGFAAACEEDSGGGGDGGGNEAEVGQTFTASLTAAEGGTLQTASGAAKLEVPAGALAADTTLTVAVVAKTADTASEIYDFGPDGQQFSTPVTLTIAYDRNPGEGNKAVLAWKDGDKWTELAGSVANAGKVTAPVTHFSHFAIIITAAGVEQQGACGDLAAGFDPCGGSLEGTWTIETLCLWFDPEENPFGGDEGPFADCPTLVWSMSVDWDGTYTVDATNIHTAITRSVMNSLLEVPNDCFPAGLDCATMAASMDEMTCTPTGNACRCTAEKVQEGGSESDMAYTIEGDVLVIANPNGGEPQRLEYCVEGDTATFHSTDDALEKGDMEWVILKKQ